MKFIRENWIFILLMICAAMLGSTCADYVHQLRVVREYEDGSGVLSDGRSFCINDEPCEEK